VTSDGYLKNAAQLLKNKKIILATYPDMLRVPFGATSLEKERSKGGAVRSVNSSLEALDLARMHKDREIVFLAVGFETTAPGTAIAIQEAKKGRINNFSVYSGHKTIPEALLALGRDKDLALDGFLLPGHVSAVIGMTGYQSVAKKLHIPSVISGFEALDILVSILRIVEAVNAHAALLSNEYERIVARNGNPKAKALLGKVFNKTDSVWRGLGLIRNSALVLDRAYREFDAQEKFCIKKEARGNIKTNCCCAEVLKGKIKPDKCPYFAKSCTPQTPQGACMVSREGTCRSFFEYR
jgi:hydrogenase expression/formation protein HypD